MTQTARVATLLIAGTLLLSGCSSSKPDLAACDKALRDQLAGGLAHPGTTPSTKPSQCNGVSDADLERLGTQILGEQLGTTTAPAETTEETTAPAPQAEPGDFTMSVKILTQECFGSAGCNLTYRAQIDSGPTVGGFEVTYEVTVPGDPDSPHTETLAVRDGQYNATEGLASPSKRVKSASKIKVKVIGVGSE